MNLILAQSMTSDVYVPCKNLNCSDRKTLDARQEVDVLDNFSSGNYAREKYSASELLSSFYMKCLGFTIPYHVLSF